MTSTTEPLRIMRALKKPVEIQTVKVTQENIQQIVDWIEENRGHATVSGESQLTIQTLEGPFTARVGDQVMRGVRGEFYRCDSEIYEESYDEQGPVE